MNHGIKDPHDDRRLDDEATPLCEDCYPYRCTCPEPPTFEEEPLLPPSSDPRSPDERAASPDYQIKRSSERPTIADLPVLR